MDIIYGNYDYFNIHIHQFIYQYVLKLVYILKKTKQLAYNLYTK